ncbi:uncharacterized protein si:ch211-102c2.4 [Thalassophryne amazonica]|uniref:uncharacterized protein si:ch211-102c2.4 n=1 Tax=Thalassophryne amazonica TaxID=390379 RepID=UPI001471D707|nr:uncharacterized protein si:ch211-102c2.4 [Thalassophryne amazonica]
MHLLVPLLLLAVGASEGMYLQKLVCPHKARQKTLPRIWCRQTSSRCCTGFIFSPHTLSVDGVNLRVSQTSNSFTVAVKQPRQGEGVYWCGLLSRNNTIIKLAEGYFYHSSGAYIWSFARWVVVPVLPMVMIFTTIFSRRTLKCIHQKKEELSEDTAVASAQADLLYENTVLEV